eukprot:XP_001691318.1 flagellar associated protein [Chlamydomonas reinhardtii]
MSSAHILSTFQSTFPGLYQAPKKGEDEPPPEAPAPEPVTQHDDEPDQYSTRIAGITSKFERMRASADEMEQYLRSAAEDAKEAEARALAKADEDFTPAWRNVGLPLKPSHLHLDHGAMAGARLVNPKAIVQEYQAIKGREVLNPPRIAEYADTSAKPNYLKSTHAMEERKMRTMSPDRTARIQALSARHLAWQTLTPEEVAAKMEEAEQRRRQLGLKMPRAQFELEQKIIQSMHHKLTFLRNPRHPLPPAVKTLMELRPDANRWVGPRTTDCVRGAGRRIPTERGRQDSAVRTTAPSAPVGRAYEQVVRVRNVTAVSRSLRIFPPASQYFHASLPRFPGEVGVLAPGMAAEVTLRFCPDSLGDYEDAIAVDATHSRQTEIDMGQVVIGNVKTEQVTFKNMGGAGRFRIVPEAHWPDFAMDAPTDRAVVGQFKIWPLYFEMAAGEQLGLNVSYEPTEWGNTEERLVLVCDNCQVKTFSLSGNAVGVDVLLHSVDGRMLEPRELDLPLWFGECAPGAGFSKTVSVRNTTKLPFAFEWGLTKFPQVQNRRRANEPLQTEAQYDEEQDDEGHVLLAHGPDPLALGAVVEDLFRVVPRSGVLQPGEVMEFLVTFTPPGQARYERWAQLRVDRKPISVPSGASPMVRGSGSGTGRSHAAIAASATCDVLVAEVGLEGLGCPVQLSAAPRLVSLPGKLMPAEGTTRHVTLRNPTRAQVVVRATVDNPAIAVEHGPPVPIEVRAAVGSSYARLITPRINFGDVPLSGSSEQRLVIRNMSATCPTPWSIRELTPALVAAEKSRLLRAQLLQSSRMLDPQAAAAAIDALRSPAASTSGALVALPASAAERRAVFAAGRHTDSSLAQALPPPDTTHVTFEPSSGVLEPNQELTVRQTLYLTNLSQLPVLYRWTAEAEDEGSQTAGLAELKIKPDHGELEPGEDVEIQVRYTPRYPGPCVMYGVCELEGAPEPLGFRVSSAIHGLDVTYDLLTQEQYDDYMAHDQAAAALGSTGPKGAAAMARHLVADFGHNVPLGETRQMYLVVTNRTAMHTSIRTWLERFGVADASRFALGNKGLAVSVTPPESTLEPWSRLVLTVSCFNDMCGAYMDMMHVKVGDLPARDIPVLVGVSGTPLVVQRERVLVRGLRARSWRTDLEWGQVPQGVEQTRTFYVFNTGSLDMHLAWEARRYHDYVDLERLPPTTDVGAGGTGQHDSLWGGAPGTLRDTRAGMKLFDVKLQPDERAGCVRLATERHADPTDDVPFRVEPEEQVIKGNTTAKFTVTFCASESRRHGGYLHGTQRVFSPESPLELRVWTAGENADRVGALLSGTFHPYAGAPPTPLQPLRVDLGAQAQACRLEPDGQTDLSWVVTSIQQPGSHAAFVRSVTLSNTAHCPQVFSLDVEGPWDMVAASPSVPQDPVAYRGTSTLLGPAAASGRLGTSAADGGLTFLPPGESVDAKQRVIETVNDYKNTGALCITFANGDSQSLPLVAEMLHPRLEVKPRKLDFKKVHLQSPKEMFVMLSNPTNVDAAWAVTRISITFAPTEAEAYEGELIFAVLRGKQCSVDVDGEGSIEETDETKGNLFVI